VPRLVRRSGANGSSAEQVLGCAIVKILFNSNDEELAFHIVSPSLRFAASASQMTIIKIGPQQQYHADQRRYLGVYQP
jgi:hypothetical protein